MGHTDLTALVSESTPSAACEIVSIKDDLRFDDVPKAAIVDALVANVASVATAAVIAHHAVLEEGALGNTNVEPRFDMTADGSTRAEWADWQRAYALAPEISPKRAAYLYALMTFVQAELEKLGIRSYADGGTLLGQARDGGIIRYDDDIDLQVHPEDKAKFLAAAELLTERVRAWGRAIGEAADLVWCRFGYKALLIPNDVEMRVLRKPGSMVYFIPEDVVVDIFLMDVTVDAAGVERVSYADEPVRRMLAARGDGEVALAKLGALPVRPFGPTQVRVPEDSRGACVDVFGPHCFDRVVCKDGRNSEHSGGSLAVPMDEASLTLYNRLVNDTRDI